MTRDFVVARNPDGDSSLPFLVRLRLAAGPVVLKVRDTWRAMARGREAPADHRRLAHHDEELGMDSRLR